MAFRDSGIASLSTFRSVDAQCISLSTDSSVDVQGAPLYAFVPFIVNAGMPYHPQSWQSAIDGIETGNLPVPKSGYSLRYRIEKTDVGMPMPSYDCSYVLFLDRAIETNICSKEQRLKVLGSLVLLCFQTKHSKQQSPSQA